MEHTIRLKFGNVWNFDLSNLIIWLVVIWYGGLSAFFPVIIRSAVSLLFMSYGFLYYLLDLKNNRNSLLNFLVFFLTIIYPLIASIQSYKVFGQPIIYGILSLRGIWDLYISYLLYRIITPNKFLKIISKYHIAVILTSFVLLYIFNIDDNVISGFQPKQDDIITTGTSENNMLRGARFTFGHSYILFCVAYLNSLIITHPSKCRKYISLLILVLIDLLLIHKGRSTLISAIIVFAIPYLRHLNFKKCLKYTIISILCIAIFLSIPAIRDRFLVIYDLFGETKTSGTGDFSGVARLNEILLAIPLILQHPIFGVGNLSYHFNNGFIGYFLDHFYIGDIGIVGILLVGGINLYVWYVIFFYYIQKHIPQNETLIKTIMFSLCCCSIFSPWIGGNSLWDSPIYAIFLLSISLFYFNVKDTPR